MPLRKADVQAQDPGRPSPGSRSSAIVALEGLGDFSRPFGSAARPFTWRTRVGLTEGSKQGEGSGGALSYPGYLAAEPLVARCWHPSRKGGGHRGAVTPQLRRGDSVSRSPTGPAGARVCDFTPEVWLIPPSPVLRGWSGCTWHGRVAASDDRSRLRGRGSPKLASSRPVWDPDFNGALFFLGTVLTYQISLCVYECGEVWRAVFLQKKKKSKNKIK